MRKLPKLYYRLSLSPIPTPLAEIRPLPQVQLNLTICGFSSIFEQSKEAKMREKVQAVLEQVRPALLADGGDVQLIDVNDGVVTLKLTGACSGCPMSTITLKDGIERVLKEQVPEVKEVVAV
jgi:Fe-S cluster biogenesis protein NfuA